MPANSNMVMENSMRNPARLFVLLVLPFCLGCESTPERMGLTEFRSLKGPVMTIII